MNPYITPPFFTFATLKKTSVTLLVKYLYSIYRVSGEGHFLSVKTKIAAIFLPGSLKLAVDENQRLTFLNQRPNIPEYESVFRPQIGKF